MGGIERSDEEEREKERARMNEDREREERERERQRQRDKLTKEMKQEKSGKQAAASETAQPGTHAEAIERAREKLGIESNDPLSRAFLERYVKAEERDKSLQDVGEDEKLRNPEAWKDSLQLAKLLAPNAAEAHQEHLANRILGTAVLRDKRLDAWGIRDLLAEKKVEAAETKKQALSVEEYQTTKVADYVAKPSSQLEIRKVEFKSVSPEQKKEQRWQETKEKMKAYLRTRGYKVDGPWEMAQGYGVLNAEFFIQAHLVEASGKFTREELKQIGEYLRKVGEKLKEEEYAEFRRQVHGRGYAKISGVTDEDRRHLVPDSEMRQRAVRWLETLDNLLHAYDQIAALGGVVPGGVSGRGRAQRMPGETAWGSPLKPEAVRQHVERVERPLEAPPRMPEPPKKIQGRVSPFEKADTIRMPGSDNAYAPQIPPREPPAPAVRQPEVAQAPRHDTMAPAIRVQPEAKWWRRTQRQTAPAELGPTPRQESGQAGKPEVKQPSEPGARGLFRTVKPGATLEMHRIWRSIPEYSRKTLSRLADNQTTCDRIQYTFRKAGLSEKDVVDFIGYLQERANQLGLDPQTAEKAIHSHLEREAASINHMKDKLGLDWDGVRQIMREPVGSEGDTGAGAFGSIAEAHEHSAYASYLRSIEKAGIELSSPEGQRARVEAARRAHQDGINYVKQLQESWSRGGLKSLDDYAKSGESGSD